MRLGIPGDSAGTRADEIVRAGLQQLQRLDPEGFGEERGFEHGGFHRGGQFLASCPGAAEAAAVPPPWIEAVGGGSSPWWTYQDTGTPGVSGHTSVGAFRAEQAGQLLGAPGQRRERAEVHRDHLLHFEQAARVRGLLPGPS
jgi:hypothetical protein